MAPYKQAETGMDLQTKCQEEGQLLGPHSESADVEGSRSLPETERKQIN